MRAPRCAGLVQPDEGRRLASLARQVPDDREIVELGTHTGLSTCWMASDAWRSHITAIDPWAGPRPDSEDDPFGLGDKAYEQFAANVAAEGHWGRITPLRAKSTDVAPFWVKSVGLLFIDAVHEYDAVRDDYLAWQRHIPVGGWLAFHDYTEDANHPYFGVAQAIADHVAPSGSWAEPVIVGNLWTAKRLTRE